MTGPIYRKKADGSFEELYSPMTVLKKTMDGNFEKEIIDLELDVLFSVRHKNHKIYHTLNGEYRDLVPLDDIEKYVPHYYFLDNCNVVNMMKIKSVDEKLKKAFFVKYPNKDSKEASFSAIVFKILMADDFLNKLIANNNNDQYEEKIAFFKKEIARRLVLLKN